MIVVNYNEMKYVFAVLLCLITMQWSHAQNNKRYKDMVFEHADIQEDMNYAADTVSENDKPNYKFDLYQPASDKATNRPLIIWMHGGGFVFGSKKDRGIKLWSTTFARRGYVCAAIDYRMGKKTNIFNFDKLIQNAYPAIIDARQAVAYFRKNYKRYGIDPDKIILAGNSAGGFMALQAAYSNNTQLASSLHIDNPVQTGVHKKPAQVAAVINFWGGLYDQDWLKNANVPIVSVCGSDDKIVQPGIKKGVYGSVAIHKKADELNIPNQLKVFDGYGHELEKHFNPLPIHPGKKETDERWLQAGQFAANFLYPYVTG